MDDLINIAKAQERAAKDNVDVSNSDNIIIYLERQLEHSEGKVTELVDVIQEQNKRYREKINALGNQNEEQAQTISNCRERIAQLERLVGKMYGECIKIQPPAQLEAVKENSAAEIIKALSDNGFNNISINIYKTKEE